MTGLEWTHAMREVPAAGLAVARTATPEEAARVAEALDILGVEALVATYRIKPVPGGRYRLAGEIKARVVQACVVSLEPVVAEISSPFEVILAPAEALAGNTRGPDGDEADADGIDTPLVEPIVNGEVDVGRIVYEELTSQLDPYPRRPDANFEWTDDRLAAADVHPFAKLAHLRGEPKKS